ncbi:MAG: hypothetical protein IJ583_11390 [Firmicutes bacterium]|nr:hypothetical protein [Bacillota bacterium]
MNDNIKKYKCRFCNSDAKYIETIKNKERGDMLINCGICGRYKYNHSMDLNKYTDEIAFYLYHNGVHCQENDIHNKATLNDKYAEYIWIDNKPHYYKDGIHFRDVSLNEIIAFNNINLEEMVLLILQNISSKSKYRGDTVSYNYEELASLYFAKRTISDENSGEIINKQIEYIAKYLISMGYVEFSKTSDPLSQYRQVILTFNGWKLVEKNNYDSSKSKDVFIAMSYDESLADTERTIRDVLIKLHYNPIVMKDVQHNHQIVPEMLYQIRKAKFVIADFTLQNNGAYYEAGYALGQNKEVIHLCREDELSNENSKLHFDIAQVNTIIWKDYKDLKEKLTNRIEATIT